MVPARRIALWLPTASTLFACLALNGCSDSITSHELTPVSLERPNPETALSAPPLLPAEVAKTDWLGWRGGVRHGVALADPPVQWNAHETRWSVSVPGQGNSSPVICGGQVFLTTQLVEPPADDARDGEAAETASLAVLCYAHDTGELLWLREVGPAVGRTHRRNGFASATVACDGQRVVASFGAAGLHCFDLEGRPLWTASLAPMDHPWGAASSPVIHNHRVFQLSDSQTESTLAAFDVTTGRRLWTVARESQGCWTTPTVVEVGDTERKRSLLVVNGSTRGAGSAGDVTAYDPTTGAEVWRVTGTSDIPCPSAVVVRDEQDQTLLISATGGNGPIFAIRPDGSGDVTETHVTWRHPTGGPYVPTGVYHNGRYFSIADGGVLTCYRPGDGHLLWRARLRGAFSASLVAASGRIYAVSERGDVYVLAAGDQYELLAVNRMQERCLATPAVSGTRLYVRSEDRLHCIERKASVVLYETPAGENADLDANPNQAKPTPLGETLRADPAACADVDVSVGALAD